MSVWVAKVDGVDKVMAAHINKLQTEKVDIDGPGNVILTSPTNSTWGLIIRHGGDSGEGFIHPANGKAAFYITGRHTSPVAGYSPDLANFYHTYTGDLSAVTDTLEGVEIVNRASYITASPTQALIGLEVAAGTISEGEMGSIVFPVVYGIYGDVNMCTSGDGTITLAAGVLGNLPSGVAGTAITTACGLSNGMGSLSGATITDAYGLYIRPFSAGTNNTGIYVDCPINGTTKTGVYITGDAAGLMPFHVHAQNQSTGLIAKFSRVTAGEKALILGAIGGTGSVVASEGDLYLATASDGTNLGTTRLTMISSTGDISTTSNMQVGLAFGCNSKTAQQAYASGGDLAAYVTGAFGLDSDVKMSALHAMVVSIRAALVANGIMS